MALGKKKIAIIAGVSAAVLVTALGVGLGVGLSSDSSRTPSALDDVLFNDPIKNEVRNGKDLLINGLTFNNKRFNVVEDNNKLFVVIPKNSHLELTQPEFNYDLNDETFSMGGVNFAETIDLPPASAFVGEHGYETTLEFNGEVAAYKRILSYGENYFYTFVFGNIGHVKITNDGYVWGGFKYNEDTNQIEKHEALTNGPLKFGTLSPEGYVLIDLAVVHQYQQASTDYNDATGTAKAEAAERMRNADSMNSKENRDSAEITWKILNSGNQAYLFLKYITESVTGLPLILETTGTEDKVFLNPPLLHHTIHDDNTPALNENGKFNAADLDCGDNNIHGFWLPTLYHDDNTKACIEPETDENGLAIVNQEVKTPLGDLNYRLYNFQGGHIKNPLLGDISATPDGYVTLPDITDRVQVQEKTNYVVVPSDLKFELNKASSS